MTSVVIFLLFGFIALTTADVSGRWIQDGGLGVFLIDKIGPQSYLVTNAMYKYQSWHYANLTENGNKTYTFRLSSGTLTGQSWAQGTHITWSNSVTWHRYGSDVTCNQPTVTNTHHQHHQARGPVFHGPAQQFPNVTKVHVVISTHFDLGYTDFAWCTVSHYIWQIYPGVLQTSLADPTFIYTTHPWLLYFYFNCDRLLQYVHNVPGLALVCPTPAMQQDLAAMIRRGQLTWHAFAFDGFNELLGQQIFSLGFDFASWLSETFNVPKVQTMSNIDVPGVFGSQLPILKSKNIKALYIGQNPYDGWAGAPLTMPDMFMWNGVLTMIHKLGYGGITPFDAIVDPVTNEALVVQCVLENSPPYTPTDVAMYLARIQMYFPGAVVVPSTFDSFSSGVLTHTNALPTNTLDIGETWIRAISSDPIKTSTFLQYRRDFEICLDIGKCREFDTSTMDEVFFLMTGAEHNWGLPCNFGNWEYPALSYQEKRDFLLSSKKLSMARQSGDRKKKIVSPEGELVKVPFRSGQIISCGVWNVSYGKDGAIYDLTNSVTKKSYASPTNTFGKLLYTIHETQGPSNNVSTGWGDPLEQYLIYQQSSQFITGYYTSTDAECKYHLQLQVPQNTSSPLQVLFNLTFPKNGTTAVLFDYTITGKEMSYNMYASWTSTQSHGDALSVQFLPSTTSPHWYVTNLGTTYDPSAFNKNGVTHFHVADAATLPNVMTIVPLDTPLLMFGSNAGSWASGDWGLPANYSAGSWFNIFNQWNANWVAGWPWNDNEVVTARYVVQFL